MRYIRVLNHEDISKVSDLLCTCYRWLGEKECLTPKNIEFLVEYRGSVDTVRHEAEAEKYYVACNDTEIVGMVSVKKNEITKLYVHPLWHRKGVGQLLFEKAEEIIVKSGHTRIILGVIGESPVSFYKSMGMIVSGRKPLKLEHESVREVILMERLLK